MLTCVHVHVAQSQIPGACKTNEGGVYAGIYMWCIHVHFEHLLTYTLYMYVHVLPMWQAVATTYM